MTRHEHAELYNKHFVGNGSPLIYTKYSYQPDRSEWDITIPEKECIKEYCSTSGEWTDIVYNIDGTFTHTPTKEEDIPVMEC